MSFGSAPYEGIFCNVISLMHLEIFISIQAFGHWGFGQHTHLPAPLPYQPHQRGNVTCKTWPYLYNKCRESFFLLVSHSQSIGLEPHCGAELLGDRASVFGTYHECQNCISGHAEASDVPHHPWKDVALYFNEYKELAIFSSICHTMYKLASRNKVLLQQLDWVTNLHAAAAALLCPRNILPYPRKAGFKMHSGQ